MSKSAFLLRPMALVAAIGFVATGASAQAATPPKEIKVTMPASALADSGKKLCISKMVFPPKRRSGQPETICQTRDEWQAQGVSIVAK